MPTSKPTPKPSIRRWKAPRATLRESTGLKTAILFAVLGIVGLVIALMDLQPDLSHLDNTIASGSALGQYHRTAETLAAGAAQKAGRLVNRATHGSVENLQLLQSSAESCEVQFALVQDGLDWSAAPSVLRLGRLQKAESVIFLGADAGAVRRFADLRGKRIGIGPEGSGAGRVARQLLTSGDLAELGLTLSHHPMDELVARLARRELDLGVFVIDEDATLIRDAVRNRGLQLAHFEHLNVLARQHAFVRTGWIRAGQYDQLRVLPEVDKQVLRVDTLLVGNGCATRAQTLGMLSLVADAFPGFIEHNRDTEGLSVPPLHPAAEQFFADGGVDWVDRTFPWLGDIMPPSNWVHVIMAVSVLFNLMGFGHRFRLWRIDAGRVEAERAIAHLFGSATVEQIADYSGADFTDPVKRERLDAIIVRFETLMARCRRHSLSVLVPMGAEMSYRYQESLMADAITELRRLRERADR